MPNRGRSCCRPNARSCASRGCAPGHSRKARGERVRAGWRRLSRSVDLLPADSKNVLIFSSNSAPRSSSAATGPALVSCCARRLKRRARRGTHAPNGWPGSNSLRSTFMSTRRVRLPGRAALPRPRSMHSRTLADDAGLARLAVAPMFTRTSGPRAARRAARSCASRRGRAGAQASASLPALESPRY